MASSRLGAKKRRNTLLARDRPGISRSQSHAADIVQLASQAGEILSRAREAALAPGIKKTLRKFNLKSRRL